MKKKKEITALEALEGLRNDIREMDWEKLGDDCFFGFHKWLRSRHPVTLAIFFRQCERCLKSQASPTDWRG